MIQVQWTASSPAEAKAVARVLIEKKWVACANLFPIDSLYTWEGELEEAKEVKVVFKTLEQHYPKILAYIIENGSYDVPEVSKIAISATNPDYEKWVKVQTQSS